MDLKWQLSHIRGYLELGMVADAADEFAKIPSEVRDQLDVLKVAVPLYQEQALWPETRKVAAELCGREPENAGWWVAFAYATRRAESLEAAENILLAAVKLHPDEATIVFNLGCYSCQRGDLKAAEGYIEKAIRLDEHFRDVAKTDPDLEELRRIKGDPS